MTRTTIESNPLALETYLSRIRRGEYLAAAKGARDSGNVVAEHLIDLPHLSTYEALERRNPVRAAAYLNQYARQIAEAKEARAMLTELARGGPGLSPEEVRAAAPRPPNPVLNAPSVINASRAAEAARLKAAARSAAIAARLAAKAAPELAALKAGHQEKVNALDSRFRDRDGSVRRGVPNYIEQRKVIDDAYEAHWQKRYAEIQTAAAAELDAPPPQPPAAA